MGGRYGRVANFLIELANLIELAVTWPTPAAVLVTDANDTRYPITNISAHLNLTAATRGWACVLNSLPAVLVGFIPTYQW